MVVSVLPVSRAPVTVPAAEAPGGALPVYDVRNCIGGAASASKAVAPTAFGVVAAIIGQVVAILCLCEFWFAHERVPTSPCTSSHVWVISKQDLSKLNGCRVALVCYVLAPFPNVCHVMVVLLVDVNCERVCADPYVVP
ncbi:hypothetical protein PCASD_06032 [Puccinia coronata f. sp. avenae]|uniref:Uncharacterized protein n=1 Tax=Puccinia coronata f. sp. avenae TaxID=200324 RepID=A0A2N5VA38_9BASI|nr:hypothetical protein PCASD_06032 [Puccinia coronata f. sp. avenae]